MSTTIITVVVLELTRTKAAIAAVKKAGKTAKARSRHLQEVVNTVAEIKEGGGEVKLGWVKAHMGILGNEAADVLAKNAAEGVPPDDHKKWMWGGVFGSGRNSGRGGIWRKAREQ